MTLSTVWETKGFMHRSYYDESQHSRKVTLDTITNQLAIDVRVSQNAQI